MPDPQPRRRRVRRWLLTSGLVLAVLVPAVLWWIGHQTVLQVHTLTGTPVCEGTELTTTEDFSDDFRRTAIPLDEGFVCTVPIQVSNHSDHVVKLGEVTVPVGGPAANASFRVTHLAGQEIPDDDEVDAVIQAEQTLEPGAQALVEVRVVFRGSGCTSRGAAMWVDPVIEVSDLLASHDLRVTGLPIFLGTTDSSCDT